MKSYLKNYIVAFGQARREGCACELLALTIKTGFRSAPTAMRVGLLMLRIRAETAWAKALSSLRSLRLNK